MFGQERLDLCDAPRECVSEFREWRPTAYDHERDSMRHHRITFIRLVANARVVRDSDPPSSSDFGEPLLIGRRVVEMRGVSLDPQSGFLKDRGKPIPQIPVCEVDEAQATRS